MHHFFFALLVSVFLPFSAATASEITERIGIYTGTFDPPHSGHRELIERAAHLYQLTRFYIIVNTESDHKKSVSSYALRKEMSLIEFAGANGAIVGDVELENAFRQNDVEGVMDVLEARHPKAALYQIMGDDSYERFLKINGKPRARLNILVNPREANVRLSAKPSSVASVQLLPYGGESTSSTAVRKQIAAGIVPKDISRGTMDVIYRNALYGSRIVNCKELFKTASGN